MNKTPLFLSILLSLLLSGCFGSSSDSDVEVAEDVYQYVFVAEDGPLINLSVRDAVGVTATQSSPGEYRFNVAYTPVLPITFAGTEDSYQEIDGVDGFTQGDLPYRVSFRINYLSTFVNNSERTLFANPLTALIPESGIPSEGIAGLPETVFEAALLQGITSPPDTTITVNGEEKSLIEVVQESASLLTALQEGVIQRVSAENADSQALSRLILTDLSENSNGSGLESPDAFSNWVSSVMTSGLFEPVDQAALVAIGHQLASLAETIDLTGVDRDGESMIALVQQQLVMTDSVEAIEEKLTMTGLDTAQTGLGLGAQLAGAIESAGTFSDYLATLFLVPINIEPNGQSLVDDGVTGFGLTSSDDDQITLSGSGAFFDQMTLDYHIDVQGYGMAVTDTQAVIVTLNANVSNFFGQAASELNAVRLMVTCEFDSSADANPTDCGSEGAVLEYYAIATATEICQAGFATDMIDVIDTLNEGTLGCTTE